MSTIDRTGCLGRAPHGTASAAQKRGCTCPDAQEDYRRARSRWRHGYGQPAIVDATGTRRRLEALAALGWSATEIAARAGIAPDRARSQVTYWRRAHSGRVHRRTAATVARIYEELSGTPGPSSSALIRARRAGWAPPLAWYGTNIDDPRARARRHAPLDHEPDGISIFMVCAGAYPITVLRPADRALAVAVLTARGLNAEQIAALTHTTTRTVHRKRAAGRAA